MVLFMGARYGVQKLRMCFVRPGRSAARRRARRLRSRNGGECNRGQGGKGGEGALSEMFQV